MFLFGFKTILIVSELCLIQMFADIHHLHQFVSLDQGGSVAAVSFPGGTHPGATSIFFGIHQDSKCMNCLSFDNTFFRSRSHRLFYCFEGLGG